MNWDNKDKNNKFILKNAYEIKMYNLCNDYDRKNYFKKFLWPEKCEKMKNTNYSKFF